MISDILIAELAGLFFIYFRYFGNVLFITYHPRSSSELQREYQNLTEELKSRLPDYKVQLGFFQPPNVLLFIVILALQFHFRGLYKFILKIFKMSPKRRLITLGLLVFVTLLCIVDVNTNFGIYYEGHTVFAKDSTDIDKIPPVDQLVDIIKENAQGLTFPKGIIIASLAYFGLQTLNPPKRRR